MDDLVTTAVQRFGISQADLGESVVWHPLRKRLGWVDVTGQRIFEAALDDAAGNSFPTDRPVTAIVPTRAGGYLAVLHDRIDLFDPTTGSSTSWIEPGLFDSSTLRFNDAKCDAAGRLWVGTLSLHGKPGNAALYRIEPDGAVELVMDSVSLSNGMAWSDDRRKFYYIDSPTRQVQEFDFDVDRGTITSPRVAVDLREIPGVPDGCTLDRDGQLWIAQWGGACVTRWDPASGRLTGRLALPVSLVTNCTFAGPALDRLFITTARTGLTTAELAMEPAAGGVFTHCLDVAGMNPHLFGE